MLLIGWIGYNFMAIQCEILDNISRNKSKLHFSEYKNFGAALRSPACF